MTVARAGAARLRSRWARDFGLVALLNAVGSIAVSTDHRATVAARVSSIGVAVFAMVHLLLHVARRKELRDEQLYPFESALERYTLFLGFLPWGIAVIFFR